MAGGGYPSPTCLGFTTQGEIADLGLSGKNLGLGDGDPLVTGLASQ